MTARSEDDLRQLLDEAYGRIGGMRGQLERANTRAALEAAARKVAEARVAELEAFIRFVHDQLELNGAPL